MPKVMSCTIELEEVMNTLKLWEENSAENNHSQRIFETLSLVNVLMEDSFLSPKFSLQDVVYKGKIRIKNFSCTFPKSGAKFESNDGSLRLFRSTLQAHYQGGEKYMIFEFKSR